MPKKFSVKGKIIEQNEYHKVIRPDDKNNKLTYIFSKFNDTFWECKDYKIIGPAVLQDTGNGKIYWNILNYQLHGQGRHLCRCMEIDSWETKMVDGNEETVIYYHDEIGRKYVRYVDQDGNLYKKSKKTERVDENIVSI